MGTMAKLNHLNSPLVVINNYNTWDCQFAAIHVLSIISQILKSSSVFMLSSSFAISVKTYLLRCFA